MPRLKIRATQLRSDVITIKQIEAIENIFDNKFEYVYGEGALTRVLDYLGPRKPVAFKYIGQQNFNAAGGAFFRTDGKGTSIVVDPVPGLIAYTHTGEALPGARKSRMCSIVIQSAALVSGLARFLPPA